MTTSATTSLPATDRFSWRRVGMVARYYYPSLKRPLIIFPLLSLAVGLFSILSLRYNFDLFYSGTLSTILTFTYYWSPVIFNRIESSQLTMTLPCRWSERATFVMIFALLGLPLLVMGPSTALSELGRYLYADNYTSLLTRWGATDTSIMPVFTTILLGLAMYMLPFTVALFTMFRARKSKVLKAMLFSIAALIAQIFAFGIITGVVFARHAATTRITPGSLSPDDIPVNLISNCITFMACVIGALSVMFIVLTIRRFKTTQVS